MPQRRSFMVAVLTAAVALLAWTATAPAAPLVGPNCTWNPQYGCAWFDRGGDEFYVCDYVSDGNSVVAQYVYMKGGTVRTGYARSKGHAVSSITKGRDCSRNVENHAENSRFRARTCMAYNAKPGGKPIVVLETTCGGWWNGRF
jgi:hypothetical protein